ncbi:MAG: HEAT repeat domain-containing protein [Chlamydiales bacterium]
MRWLNLLMMCTLPFSLLASVESVQRIQSLLIIGDTTSALCESKKLFALSPEDSSSYEYLFKSLGAAGLEGEMVNFWHDFHDRFPEKAMSQDSLEEMAWVILRKGLKAPGSISQLVSMIGAALTQDIYAIPFLITGLRHTNSRIRSVCLELAALYGDQPLKEEMIRILQNEPIYEVRLALYKALSQLHIEEVMPELITRVQDPKIGAQEKSILIKAIVNFRDSIQDEEIHLLASSKRAALRELACELIAHYEEKKNIKILHQLLSDPHPDVKIAALKGLGFLRISPTDQVKKLAQNADHPIVGITASWVWVLADPDDGEEALSRWLFHKNPKVQTIAAGALLAAGKYGINLAHRYLNTVQNPYVKANLALALINQREFCEESCEILDHFLRNQKEKWMILEEGGFPALAKSNLAHNPVIPNFPAIVNQKVRLKLLNILAILEYPGVEEAIKLFLHDRQWGLTGLAAELLLSEGSESAIDHVRAILESQDPHTRVEAALVLATWGHDPTAVPYLISAYPEGDRQLKIKILEALGPIGSRETLPFLVERLKEPSLVLRMIAASVLIQTLNS